ncbi:hypothetical protein POF50_029805 [Streptomyces sp. SL13]|uniref:Uncharacterized protein n=1 Tax=Streptantibioticus silvisoli TaxID=2705255 RepID=A0AA90HAY9_9ACTN|nr:hypothetical protein [Streptantibioticus silvisoli]MDI5973489.1 hypothetical protein [Streptantibioticus silvisoli]
MRRPDVSAVVDSGRALRRAQHREGAADRGLNVVSNEAETAEHYGWVDRAVPADELDGITDRLDRAQAGDGERDPEGRDGRSSGPGRDPSPPAPSLRSAP